MEFTTPHLQTMIAVGGFIVLYLAFLVRKTVAEGLDLYDFFVLSTVALVPGIFIFFPQIARFISDLAGVTFPFVVMYGILFFIIFAFLYRLTAEMHRLRTRSRLLIQEVALLNQKLDEALPDRNPPNQTGGER